MHRRAEVRADVLRGREIVGGTVVAARRHAVGNGGEREGFRRWPEDGGLVVGVRQVDESAARKRRTRRGRRRRSSRTGDAKSEGERNKNRSHGINSGPQAPGEELWWL